MTNEQKRESAAAKNVRKDLEILKVNSFDLTHVGISLIISEQYVRLTKKCDNCIVDNISSPEINSELVESKF